MRSSGRATLRVGQSAISYSPFPSLYTDQCASPKSIHTTRPPSRRKCWPVGSGSARSSAAWRPAPARRFPRLTTVLARERRAAGRFVEGCRTSSNRRSDRSRHFTAYTAQAAPAIHIAASGRSEASPSSPIRWPRFQARTGELGGAFTLSMLVVLCAIAFGLLVSSFGWTEKQIGSTVPVILLVMGLLGGCMFPRLLMPPFMQKLGQVVPHSWALDGYYAVLVRQGTSIADIAPSLAALSAFSLGFALLGLWRFKFE